ncbi:MAG: hypothetical protein ABJB33_02970 [Gemmatimonadota bacterium]
MPNLLTISPARRAREAAWAEEIQTANQAIVRERLWWFGAAMGCVALGSWLVGMGFHSTDLDIAPIWLGSGILLGEIGPLVILVIAVRREQL